MRNAFYREKGSDPFLQLTLTSALALWPSAPFAWGPEGHAAIGILAVEQAAPATRLALQSILGALDDETIAERCNWPDWYRDHGGGEASAPLHYVNVPVDATRYNPGRDCPTGRCAPAAIVHYAGVLGDANLPIPERREAFAFLCHIEADMHQPLHVAYADDKGGGLVTVEFEGEPVSLHWFWDAILPAHYASGREQLASLLRQRPNPSAPAWQADQVVAWANESLNFTRQFAYPPNREISPEFAQATWNVVQQQMDMAAVRLARILDAGLAASADQGAAGSP